MTITMEECGELTQECSKIMRKYYVLDDIDDEDIDKLKKEAADVYAMIHNGLFDYVELEVNAKKKRKKLKKWSTLIDE